MIIASGAFANAADDLFDLLYGGNYTLRQVQKLVKSGAKINGRDDENHTPLMEASGYSKSNEQLDVIKFLLKNGADVNAKDDEGCTALMSAAMFSRDIEIIKTLIEAGENINSIDNDGITILMETARNMSNNEVTFIAYAQQKSPFLYCAVRGKNFICRVNIRS